MNSITHIVDSIAEWLMWNAPMPTWARTRLSYYVHRRHFAALRELQKFWDVKKEQNEHLETLARESLEKGETSDG